MNDLIERVTNIIADSHRYKRAHGADMVVTSDYRGEAREIITIVLKEYGLVGFTMPDKAADAA